MTAQGCFTLAVRAHELHAKRQPYGGAFKSWDEVSWYFLLLWAGSK